MRPLEIGKHLLLCKQWHQQFSSQASQLNKACKRFIFKYLKEIFCIKIFSSLD
jgi:hypothetical protein